MEDLRYHHIDVLKRLNPHPEEGGAFGFDSIKTAYELFKNIVPIRKDFSRSDLAFLNTYGNWKIDSLTIIRTPLSATAQGVLNLVSVGELDRTKARLGYDQMFHLALIGTVVPPEGVNGAPITFLTERNETLRLRLFQANDVGRDTEKLVVPLNNPSSLTLNSMFDVVKRKMGDKLWEYDPFKNNCQDFVIQMLGSNGLLNPQISDFVRQNIDTIADTLNKYNPYTTDIASGTIGILARLRALTGLGLSQSKPPKDEELPAEVEDIFLLPTDADESKSRLRILAKRINAVKYWDNEDNHYYPDAGLYYSPAQKRTASPPRDMDVNDLNQKSSGEEKVLYRGVIGTDDYTQGFYAPYYYDKLIKHIEPTKGMMTDIVDLQIDSKDSGFVFATDNIETALRFIFFRAKLEIIKQYSGEIDSYKTNRYEVKGQVIKMETTRGIFTSNILHNDVAYNYNSDSRPEKFMNVMVPRWHRRGEVGGFTEYLIPVEVFPEEVIVSYPVKVIQNKGIWSIKSGAKELRKTIKKMNDHLKTKGQVRASGLEDDSTGSGLTLSSLHLVDLPY